MGLKLTLISVLIMIIYLILGGVIFWSIEHDIEVQNKDTVYSTYARLKQADCIPFKDFDDLLALAWSLPQSFDPNKNSSSPWQWDFAGSVFFSFVVVSTVGFGNQAPSTIGGQAAVILYSLLGIPIYLNVVSRMSADGKKLLVKLENKLSPKVNNYDFVIIGIFALIFFAAICLIPAALLTITEDWTFHESMYFSFITLSTIGFGDYVAGTDQQDYFKVLLIIWMLAGLVYFTACVSYLQFLFEKLAQFITRTKVTAVDEKASTYTTRIPVKYSKPVVKRVIKTPIPIRRV